MRFGERVDLPALLGLDAAAADASPWVTKRIAHAFGYLLVDAIDVEELHELVTAEAPEGVSTAAVLRAAGLESEAPGAWLASRMEPAAVREIARVLQDAPARVVVDVFGDEGESAERLSNRVEPRLRLKCGGPSVELRSVPGFEERIARLLAAGSGE